MTLPISPTYKFSLFKNLLTAHSPELTIDINQLYEIVRFGYLKQEIEALRKTHDKEAYKRIKRKELFGYNNIN